MPAWRAEPQALLCCPSGPRLRRAGLTMLQPCPAAPCSGLGLWGGLLGERIKSGANCYPSLGSELRWAQPEHRTPFLGTNIPAAMLSTGICSLQICWDAGGFGSQPSKLDMVLLRELLSSGRAGAQGALGGTGMARRDLPNCVLLS